MATHYHNTPALPKQTPRRVTGRCTPADAVLPADQWEELHDNLVLALDTRESGPLDPMGLRDLVAYQRAALKGCRTSSWGCGDADHPLAPRCRARRASHSRVLTT